MASASPFWSRSTSETARVHTSRGDSLRKRCLWAPPAGVETIGPPAGGLELLTRTLLGRWVDARDVPPSRRHARQGGFAGPNRVVRGTGHITASSERRGGTDPAQASRRDHGTAWA